MSSAKQDDPAKKLLNNPDFMEKLLPFLDAESTLSLARSKISKCLDILQDKENPSNWRKMIKRSLPDNIRLERMPTRGEDLNLLRATFEQMGEQLKPLVDMLKLMKDSNSPMQDLLKAICDKSSEESFNWVEMSSSSHGSRQISPLSFLLLEAVEVEFNSALYEIVSIGFSLMDDLLLTALAARLARQNRKITSMYVKYQLRLMSTSCAETLCTLIQNCERASLGYMRVSGNIEAVGWAALAKALSLSSVSVLELFASRELAKEGRSEDLRIVWESLKDGWCVQGTGTMFPKSHGEAGWEALKQMLD